MNSKKKSSRAKKVFLYLMLVVIIAGGGVGYYFYSKIFSPNLSSEVKKGRYFYVHTGWKFDDVVKELEKEHLLKDINSFVWLAEKMKYNQKVLPGKYRIKPGLNNKQLISLLRSGMQEPIKVVFNNLRTKEQLAGRISQQIEADSLSILESIKNDSLLTALDLTKENALVMFIPNTYEFYWNTSAKQFVSRMAKEYNKFWSDERKSKAVSVGIKPSEVSVLASIVQSESNKRDEQPTIAGVYLNRLKKDCLLEADPTLVFASGDYTIKRVLNIHKSIDSPYNTYMYKGLPPGPITIPTSTSIDAVLNYLKHDYMYFCAKDDLSGYHNFAVTLSEHMANARKFHNELNRRNIKK